MTQKMICFDMDGTLADLYGVPNWLEKLRSENPSPYLEAKPLWDMDRLRQIMNDLLDAGWEIRIISWLAKDSSESYKNEVRRAKLNWLASYNLPINRCHLVAYGTTKADCVRRSAQSAILVDDDFRVRMGWHLGDTINPLDGDLLERLEELARGE